MEKSLQEGSETSRVVWFGHAGSDQMTGGGAGGGGAGGGRAGGGGVKDAEILFGRDEDGRDEEPPG